MFNDLVESKPITTRPTAGTFTSFIAHYGLVLLVIYTSAQSASVYTGPREEHVEFVTTKNEPQPQEPPPPDLVAAPLRPREISVVTASIDIPNVLPEIDLRHGRTDPSDFTGKRSSAAPDPRIAGPAVPEGVPYTDNQVEKPVMVAPNSSAPSYPAILRQAGVEGEALVAFVVDTTGRVELASFKVIRTTHELFAAAVRSALPGMRFIPAEVGERRVRQLVHQPFSFAITR